MADNALRRWQAVYTGSPLRETPSRFAGIEQSPMDLGCLSTIPDYCPEGGTTCETGIGSGHHAIWLSRRGVCARDIDNSPEIVERARQA